MTVLKHYGAYPYFLMDASNVDAALDACDANSALRLMETLTNYRHKKTTLGKNYYNLIDIAFKKTFLKSLRGNKIYSINDVKNFLKQYDEQEINRNPKITCTWKK